MAASTIVWFRRDLRVADQPALVAAVARGGPVVPVFIWCLEEEGRWKDGSASRWWQHYSLQALAEQLQGLGSRLIVRAGESLTVLRELIKETGASAVMWNRRYEPEAIARDTRIKSALKKDGVLAESYNGGLLSEPWEVQTKSGGPYRVFAPFSKACLKHGEPEHPLAAPVRLAAVKEWPKSLEVDDLQLLPRIPWDAGFHKVWKPGCGSALTAVNEFLHRGAKEYPDERNRPDHLGTSRLSPALHFGELSPRQIWQATCQRFKKRPESPQVGERICGRSCGASSRITFCITSRRRRLRHCARSLPASRGRRVRSI